MFRSSGSLIGCCLALSLSVQAQRPIVLLTGDGGLRASVERITELQAMGMQVRVIAAPGAFIGTMPEDGSLAEVLRGQGRLYDTTVPMQRMALVPVQQRIALIYLNRLLEGVFDDDGTRAPMDWTAHGEHALQRPQGDRAPGGEHGGMSEAPDWACSETNNSEYMMGTVCTSVFFIESNGAVDPNTYTWPQAEINDVKAQMIDAWSIWSYTAGLHGHTVTAVMDWHEPSGGNSVQPYEPVLHAGSQDHLWIEAILSNLGRTETGAFAKCDGFNHDRRSQLGTAHAYSAFIAYNPPSLGAPTQFTDGRIGYAYLGGPYAQLLYKANGWGTNQINRVFGHETAHIFHAFDEYAASGAANCQRFFNGRQNSNFHGSTCNGAGACVMVDNVFTGSGATRQWSLCSHTPYHIGWNGLLNTPGCTSPINDQLLTANPITLHWDRMGAPLSVTGYLKIVDRVSDQVVYCNYVGTADSLQLNLVNGQYRWVIGLGDPNEANGYAGVMSAPALFTVNAPLHASFITGSANLCAGLGTTFTDQSTGAPNSWSWSFPGGTPSTWNGQQPPVIVYNAPGSYNVSLTVGDGQTNNTSTVNAAVSVTGGSPLPFNQDFNSGVMPPPGWTSYGTQGQNPLAWSSALAPGCNSTTNAAQLNIYPWTGNGGGPQIGTPRIDLINTARPYLKFRYSYARRSTTDTETLQVYGNNCNYSTYAQFLELSGEALATNGGAVVPSPAWQPTGCADWREQILRIDQLSGQIGQLWFYVFTQGSGQNLYMDDVSVFEGVPLKLRALLDGPYRSNTQLMSDTMRVIGLMPSVNPYRALGYPFRCETGLDTLAPPMFVNVGGNSLVDWVIVEVRSALSPSTVLYARPALIQRDGDVVDTDGTSNVRLGVPAGNYHVAVKHRNHLGIMSASPVALNASMPLLDLSDPTTPCYGTEARKVVGARATMWSGDVTGDGTIRYTGLNNDRDPILLAIGGVNPSATVVAYGRPDVNLDGVIKYTGLHNDRDPILVNIGGVNTSAVRLTQLP
jgi:PKD repeat protein